MGFVILVEQVVDPQPQGQALPGAGGERQTPVPGQAGDRGPGDLGDLGDRDLLVPAGGEVADVEVEGQGRAGSPGDDLKEENGPRTTSMRSIAAAGSPSRSKTPPT